MHWTAMLALRDRMCPKTIILGHREYQGAALCCNVPMFSCSSVHRTAPRRTLSTSSQNAQAPQNTLVIICLCTERTGVLELSFAVVSAMSALAVFLLVASTLGASIPPCPDEVGEGRCEKTSDRGACYSSADDIGNVQCIPLCMDFEAYSCPSSMPNKCRYHDAPATTEPPATTTVTEVKPSPSPQDRSFWYSFRHFVIERVIPVALWLAFGLAVVACNSCIYDCYRAHARVVPDEGCGAVYDVLA